MKVVLSSRGSRGDVNPIIEVASALKNAGNDVSICIPEIFKDYTQSLGIEPSVYENEDIKKLMKELGSGFGSIKGAFDLFSNSIDEQFNFMIDATKDADALVTTVNEIAAPTVAEYRKIPHFRVTFAPVLPGNHPPPFMPWQNMPVLFNKIGWSGLSMISKIIIKKFINKKRVELGLKPANNSNYYHTGKSHTLLAINPELAPPCKVWEGRYKYDYTGYCYGNIDGQLDEKQLEFIESGERPVYIGFGSVQVKNPDKFTQMVVSAVEKVGCRAVIGQGWAGLGSGYVNNDIFSIGDSHHGTLFSKMAGIIHHGGSGTTHTAARAGLPQFILPQIVDQYYWGDRIFKMGIGPKPVPPKKITVDRLAFALDDLRNGQYRTQAHQLAQNMRNDDGVQNIVNIVTDYRNTAIV